MVIFNLFSTRKKKQNGDIPDVYQYNQIPNQFRVQITHIWSETIGAADNCRSRYHDLVKILRKEYGVYVLNNDHSYPDNSDFSERELGNFFLNTQTDHALDVIELTLRYIDIVIRSKGQINGNLARELADGAINEFNERAKYHGVGYQYTDGEIVRVDSELIHSEAVIPALVVLRQKGFESAQQEFLSAHEHYRKGNKTEVLVDCLKSFESTMKIICDKRGWSYDPNKGASELVRACFENNLIPAYWQTHFSGLKSVLTSGIPTPRNKQGGHGSGSAPVQIPPDDLISYVLHMTASTILFLAQRHENML